MLVSTHNLGSVPEFCDRTILIKGTVLAHGETAQTFTQDNLELAFGGVLRHFVLNENRHGREHAIGIISDDERPLILKAGQVHNREAQTKWEGEGNDGSS